MLCHLLQPGRLRQTRMTVSCSPGNQTVLGNSVGEIFACLYSASIAVDCTLNTAAPGTLCEWRLC